MSLTATMRSSSSWIGFLTRLEGIAVLRPYRCPGGGERAREGEGEARDGEREQVAGRTSSKEKLSLRFLTLDHPALPSPSLLH
jgi:hypothetical protein